MRNAIRAVGLVALIVFLPVSLGAFLAPRLVPTPQVGVIYLWDDIDAYSAQVVVDQLRAAREEEAVKAVVIVIDSPGGEVTASENLYLSVLHTRGVKPVIASVDWMAASGAYYLAAAADEIYAKPTSVVGNIGVIGYAAPPSYIEEELLTTGPYKTFGGTQAGQVQQMEIAKESFLAAVAAGRGARLKATADFLSRGEIFSGIQALDLGLVDGLISTDQAVERAAELAGLRHYEAVSLQSAAFPEEKAPAASQRTEWTPVDQLAPGLYFRYAETPR